MNQVSNSLTSDLPMFTVTAILCNGQLYNKAQSISVKTLHQCVVAICLVQTSTSSSGHKKSLSQIPAKCVPGTVKQVNFAGGLNPRN